MDVSSLDPTLLGVIVGSVLTLAGNFLAQWFALWREEKHWARQRKAEKEDSEIQDRKNEIERIQNIYANCISRLSLISSNYRKSDNESKLTEDELAKLHSESFEWISRLKLHQRDLYSDASSKFHKQAEIFISSPDIYASGLLSEINNMFVADKLLFPGAKPVKELLGDRNVQISIDHDYRRQQIIGGVEIPRDHIIRFNISELSGKQLEILWDVHFTSNQAIPQSFVLTVPRFIEKQKEINYKGAPWEGKINPLISSPRQIFDSWEKDYLTELEMAEQSLKLAQNSGTH